jgi:tetratricopeptide (TPR) repeat protein
MIARAFTPRRVFWVFALALFLPSSLPAEEGILVVHVEDTIGHPIVGVVLAPKGDGAVGPPTDRTGRTRIRLAPATRPGYSVTLQIIPGKGGPDWVFVSPPKQRTPVPCFTNESDCFVSVVLGERGSQLLLASSRAIEAMAARVLEKLGPRLEKSKVAEEEHKRVLAQQAAIFGLEPEEIDRAIRAWGTKAKDPYEIGLAALYEGDYPKAEEQLVRSLEIRRKTLTDARAGIAEAVSFLGQARALEAKAARVVAILDPRLARSRKVLIPHRFGPSGLYARNDLQAKEQLAETSGPWRRELVEASAEVAEAAFFLGQALYERGKYREAAAVYRESLETGGEDYIELNNLGLALLKAGDLQGAGLSLQRSLRLSEERLGAEHPDLASILTNLAGLYYAQGRYPEAEPLYRRSLEIQEKVLGPEHPEVATSLNNLAALYHSQGRYAEAEPLYQRSLRISEKVLGSEHPETAVGLNNLAVLYKAQGRYTEAKSLLQRALQIQRKVLGPQHPEVATSLNNLAELYRVQGHVTEAASLYRLALTMREKALGPQHPDVAASLNNLAELLRTQGDLAEAEPLYQRSLEIREKVLGSAHPDVATSLNNLALLRRMQGSFTEAESLYQRSLEIRKKSLGPEHPDVANSLNNLAFLYDVQGRYAEAEPLYQRSLQIREKALGAEHPAVANSLNNLAMLYRSQKKFEVAEGLAKRVVAIIEKSLGPCHATTAMRLENHAAILQDLGRTDEARASRDRAQRIYAGECKP